MLAVFGRHPGLDLVNESGGLGSDHADVGSVPSDAQA